MTKEIDKIKEELVLLIKAKYPIIQIESFEEDRVLAMLESVATITDRKIDCWSITKGLIVDGASIGCKGNPDEILNHIENASNEKSIYILKDYHKYIEDPIITRRLRDLHSQLKGETRTIIITTPCGVIPVELEKAITVIDVPYPEKEEFIEVLQRENDSLKSRSKYDKTVDQVIPILSSQIDQMADEIATAGLGLTADEFENVAYKCISGHSFDLKTIRAEKKQIIKKSGTFEYYEPTESMADIGGLEYLKAYCLRTKKRYSPEAEKFGLGIPKGSLLIGPPGTGKTLTAKALATLLNQPLLWFDMASLSSKYYGETAKNVKKAFTIASSMGRVVLLFDEVEKSFSTGGPGGLHEESKRVMGSVLTHFEESKAAVYRVATSNSPFDLDPAFMQRFEKIFFVDLPHRTEREEIFSIQLKTINRNPKKFDISELALVSELFVGREIRTVVREALAAAFDEGIEINTNHIIDEINNLTPMAKQKKDEIQKMRDWAKINATPASAPMHYKQITSRRSAEV